MNETNMTKALNLIRASATKAQSNGESWASTPSLVNPEMMIFLLDRIDQLGSMVATLIQENTEYGVGYQHGFEDALMSKDIEKRPIFAWAITDHEKKWVRFSIEKPVELPSEQTAFALFF